MLSMAKINIIRRRHEKGKATTKDMGELLGYIDYLHSALGREADIARYHEETRVCRSMEDPIYGPVSWSELIKREVHDGC